MRVVERPHDFDHRLDCAEHLRALGNAWGDVIAEEVQETKDFWAGDPSPVFAAERKEIKARRDRKSRQERKWMASFRRETGGMHGAWAWQTHRGFVERVHASACQLIEHWSQLRQAAPIRSLSLTAPVADPRAFAASEPLAQLVVLSTNEELTDGDLMTLGDAGVLARVRCLSLRSRRITAAAIRYLAATQVAPQLRQVLAPIKGFEFRELVDTSQDGVFRATGSYPHFGLPPDAEELESTYGYQPWLHPCEQTPSNVEPAPWLY